MRAATLILGVALICAGAVRLTGRMAQTHTLRASPSTITWGYFDPAARPALTIASGDTVRVETVLAAAEFLQRLGVEERWITPAMRELDQVKDRGTGSHWLVGPIAVRDAEPGDVLEVRIQDIRVTESFAVNGFGPGGGTLPSDFPFQRSKVIPLDLQANVARFAPNITVPLRPFFGNLGVAPPGLTGRISSNSPGFHAGNMDNKDLVAGTTLYIPVQVPGALFSVGDGHAGQGHGEVDGSALETSLAGTFQFVVRKDLHWKWPRAETPTHLMTMGLDADLNEAARLATRDMIAFIMERYHLTETDAYMLASVAADLHVTQLVDGVKGIHALLPKEIFHAP
jgi:acetamidase/formamidase